MNIVIPADYYLQNQHQNYMSVPDAVSMFVIIAAGVSVLFALIVRRLQKGHRNCCDARCCPFVSGFEYGDPK